MRHSRQAVYSLGELANLAGISKPRLERVLLSSGVELQCVGPQGKRVVYMAELERKLPDLVDSVRFRGDGDE
jgi:hypothetical protein